MDELTERLTGGPHPVVVGGPAPTLADFRRRVEDLGFVLIKFTGTAGGTDLGTRLDRDACDLTGADFDTGSGTAHLTGSLYLNDDHVRLVADIDLATLGGTGRLEVLSEVDAAR